jgi:ribosomal protein L40E
MSKHVPMLPGDQFGAYRIDALLHAAPLAQDRTYWVTATCCGERLIRTYKTLKKCADRGSERCGRCANQARGLSMRQPSGDGIQVGDSFGGLQVLAWVTGGFMVRYSCCGLVRQISNHALYAMRSKARLMGEAWRCRECRYTQIRGEKRPQMWAVIVPATAWPRPQSLAGARL